MKNNQRILKLEKYNSNSSYPNKKIVSDYFENYNDSFKNSIKKNSNFFDINANEKSTRESKFFQNLFKRFRSDIISETETPIPFKNPNYPDIFSLSSLEFEIENPKQKKNIKLFVPNIIEKHKNNFKNKINKEKEEYKIIRKKKTDGKDYKRIEKENFTNSDTSKPKRKFNLNEEPKHYIYECNKNLKTNKFFTKLKNFKKISKIVCGTFLGQNIRDNEIIELNKDQLFIYCDILKKKYDLKFDIENSREILIKKIFEIKENFANQKSKKRIEEKIKFIYKNTLKSLKNKYINENNFRKNKKSIESFYKFYFEDLAKKLNISLNSFYDPLNHKEGSKQKSLNFKFLKLVFCSKKFKNDFFKYLNCIFKIIYQKILIKKIDSFFYKIEKKYSDQSDETKNVQMKNYLKNNKVKFAWSFIEIDDAREFFMKKINSFDRTNTF